MTDNTPEIPAEEVLELTMDDVNLEPEKPTRYSALSGDTAINLNDNVISLKDLFDNFPEGERSTFAVNPDNISIDNCNFTAAPEELQTHKIVKITLETGQFIQCTPQSLTLTSEGFRLADDITLDDSLQTLKCDFNTGESIIENIPITNHEVVSVKSTPMYTFATEFENILIPFYEPDTNVMRFTCVKQ